MAFRWVQVNSRSDEMEHWILVNRENRKVIADMWFSRLAEHSENVAVRRKIQKQYEIYFLKVWTKRMGFF